MFYDTAQKMKFSIKDFLSKCGQNRIFVQCIRNYDVNDVVPVFLLLTLNIFHIFFCCFYCRIWIIECSWVLSQVLL